MQLGSRGRDVDSMDMFGDCMIRGSDSKCQLAWCDVVMGLEPFMDLLHQLGQVEWEKRLDVEALWYDVLNLGSGAAGRSWLAEVHVTELVAVCPGVVSNRICFSWQLLLKPSRLHLRRYSEEVDGLRYTETSDLWVRQAGIGGRIEVLAESSTVGVVRLLADDCVRLQQYARCGGEVGSTVLSMDR